MLSNLFSVSLLALPLAALANPHGSAHHARHQEIAKRHTGDVQLHKRFSGARWTFYDVGLGACGKYNVESDFIVALNTPQYGGGYPGPNCFKKITMTYNGKTTQATIMDQCPGCPYGGLDLSRGLFRFFAAESEGVLYGTWSFDDGGSPPPPPPPPPKPTTSKYTPPPPPPPTTTWKPSPTSTWEPPKVSITIALSSSSAKPSSSSTSATPSTSSAKSSSSSVKPSSTSSSVIPVPTGPQNIQAANQAILNMGQLAVAGAAA